MVERHGDHEYVGRPVLSLDGRRLLTGGGGYADDLNRPGQLHAVVVRSELAHAELIGIDTAAAEVMPGVVRVVTAAELPDLRIPVRLVPTESAERALQPPLARDRVRYVGEPIAVVLAEHPYQAEDGAEAVRAEYRELPVLLEPRSALAEGSTVLHDQLGHNRLDLRQVSGGTDFDRIRERADFVAQAPITVQRHGAVPLEPRSLLAELEADGGRLSVWGAAKVKHFNRRILAGLLGREEETIRLIEGDVGGGFGARGEFYPEDFLIPWLALETGRPVKWCEDRRENLLALNHSREQMWQVEIAVSGQGDLLGLRAEGIFNQGAYARTHGGALLPALTVNHLVGPYRWPALEISCRSVLTNKTPAGTYRGPGQYEATFARERVLDIAAEAVGIDPAELRLRNLVAPEHLPHDAMVPDLNSGETVRIAEGDYPRVFRTLTESCDYEGLRQECRRRRRQGELVGLGITAFIEMGVPGPFERAAITAEPEGEFEVQVGVASVGQGVGTTLAQIAAQALDVSIDRVRVGYHDTSVAPEGLGAFSSRCTIMGGAAVVDAVRAMRADGLERAAEHLEAAADDLRVEGDRVFVAGAPAGPSVSFGELGASGDGRTEGGASDLMMGANLGLVAIDPETGQARIERWAVSYDVGRVVNPLGLAGQVIGAAAQGIGGALLEEFTYSEEGQPLAASFMDYMLPTAVETPAIGVHLLGLSPVVDGDPVSGVKGGGEGGIIAAAATLACAVADALDGSAEVATSLPLRPEDLAAATHSLDCHG